MKISNILLWGASLIIGLGISSCSDDEPTTATGTPVFPELQEYELAPGDVQQISFEANMDWMLSTDKQWFKFIDEVGQVQSVTGKAGAQTISVTITDGALGFVGDAAVVELTMGGQTQTIAQISRPANERAIAMYTEQGSNRDLVEITEFAFAYTNRSTARVSFAANFDWKFISAPDWMISSGSKRIEDLNGDAGKKLDINQLVVFEIEPTARYTDLEDFIVVGEQSGDKTYQFPVRAAGIPAKTATWLSSRYELLDGFIWDYTGQHIVKAPNSDFKPSEEPVRPSVLIRNNAYTYKLVTYDVNRNQCKEVELADTWLESIEDDGKGHITIITTPNTDEIARKLYLFVLPEGVEGGNMLYRSYFSGGEFRYKDAGYAVQLEQQPMPGGFKILNLRTYSELAGVQPASEATQIAEALNLTAADNIYEKTFTAAEWDDKGALAFISKGVTGSEQTPYKLYNAAYEVIDGKSWAGLYTFYATDPSAGRVWSINLGQRAPYAQIADDRMIMVFVGTDGQDIGTFVIKKM